MPAEHDQEQALHTVFKHGALRVFKERAGTNPENDASNEDGPCRREGSS